MKRLTLLIMVLLVLLSSCDLTMQDGPKPKMYLIINGLGYEDLAGTALNNPINDARGIYAQFRELCEAGGNEYEIIWYSDCLEYSSAPSKSTSRFTFTHYNDKSGYPTAAPVKLTGTEGMMTLDEFERRYFDIIDSLWDEKPTENDMILWYYTGHGVDSLQDENSAGPAMFYVTEKQVISEDGRKPLLTDYLALNFDRIFRNMDSYPARQLFIIDCCYSGASIENKGLVLPRDDNELGYVMSFKYAMDGKARNDLKTSFNMSMFMTDSWNHTFSGASGIPRRMVLNASTYTQQSMNADPYKTDPGIERYGGFTYRLLKYLGFHFGDSIAEDEARPPRHYLNNVITVSGMLNGVYNGISTGLRETSTPNMTRSSYDMVIWDFR